MSPSKKKKLFDLNPDPIKKTKPKKKKNSTTTTGPPPRPEEAPRLQGARHGDGGHVHRRDARDHGKSFFAIEGMRTEERKKFEVILFFPLLSKLINSFCPIKKTEQHRACSGRRLSSTRRRGSGSAGTRSQSARCVFYFFIFLPFRSSLFAHNSTHHSLVL